MIRLRPSKFTGYKHRLMAPYAVAFILVAGVGYQLTTNLRAEEATAGLITLATDKAVYHTGDQVRFTVVNGTDETVYVQNDCPEEPLHVYRQVDGQWQQIHDSVLDAGKCGDEPPRYSVGPKGGTASATYNYWPSLFNKAGTYRLVAPLAGSPQEPETTFTVVGDSQ